MNYSLTLNGEFRVAQRIRMGLIATDLLKPVDFQWMQLTQSVSDFCFNASIGLLSFGAAFLFLGVDLHPASFTALVLFLPSFALGFLIHFSVMFLFVQGILYTTNNYGISVRAAPCTDLLGPLGAPHDVPSPVAGRRRYLPFHTPSTPHPESTKGTSLASRALEAISAQSLWAVGLLLLTGGVSSFSRIVRKPRCAGRLTHGVTKVYWTAYKAACSRRWNIAWTSPSASSPP
jgi:ABC-type uncharacterized transport system permease subunit